MIQDQIGCAEQSYERSYKYVSEKHHKESEDDSDNDQEREVFPRFLRLSLPHLFRDDRTSSGCEHDADGDHEVQHRIYNIGCGKCVGSYKAGNEDSVHDRVERHEYHHDHSRQCEPQ